MLEMVSRSSLMQSLKIMVGMGSLYGVIVAGHCRRFGAFSTSFWIPSDDIGWKLVKGVPAYEYS